MDESLDDYISKSNFKIKIGNSKPKGNLVNKPNIGGGFQNKKRFTGGFQGNRVTDVSITVPAVQKTRPNNNTTNQMRDARERLVSKNKPLDAREKLNQKAQSTDARQKLMTIRSQKEPQDARAKIQAKKQLQAGQSQAKDGNFTLTRTVSNKNNNNIQLTPGPRGDIHITKTLTKVMPPGYEHIVGLSASTEPKRTTSMGPSAVKNRLGPPAGTVTTLGPPAGSNTSIKLGPPDTGVPTITRTISNPHTVQHNQSQHQIPLQPGSIPSAYEIQPAVRTPVQNVPNTSVPPPQNSPVIYHGAPPQQYPPPSQTAPYPYPPQVQPPYPQPPLPSRLISQPAPSGQGPPYPVNDPVVAGQQLQMPHHAPVVPRVQVQNDQYRPPEPQYAQYAPPPQHYAPPPQQYAQPQPQYMYPPSRQQVPYEPTPQGTFTEPQARLSSVSNVSAFKRTIVNDVQPQQQSVSQTLPLKRKLPGESVNRQSSSTGPLRSSSTNYVPIIEVAGNSESPRTQKPKLTKITAPGVGEPVAKRVKEDEDDDNVISPLQGFKVAITNLAHSVTQDDIIELFGAIGAVKSVKLVKPGTAEVTYVKKDIASLAVKTYHDRELDGHPMVVKLVTPLSARIKEAPEKLPASVKPVPSSPLKFSKATGAKGKVPDKKEVDVLTLHKALFKTGTSAASKPVTFTVNI